MVNTYNKTYGGRLYNGTTPALEVEGEEKFLKSLDKIILTADERSEIIESAVPIAERHLRSYTPYLKGEDISNKKLYGKSIGHLRDGIVHQPKQYPDGSTDLGFNYKVAPIARWTNWGTYRQKPQFWFEKAFFSFPKKEFFGKETETARKIFKRKGLL